MALSAARGAAHDTSADCQAGETRRIGWLCRQIGWRGQRAERDLADYLLRYQDAAEKAIRAVIPNRPQVSLKKRRTGKQITEKLTLFRELLGKSARLDGDILILHTRTPGYMPCATVPAPVAGWYRVRISASAVGTGDKPLPMLCVCRDQYARGQRRPRCARRSGRQTRRH